MGWAKFEKVKKVHSAIKKCSYIVRVLTLQSGKSTNNVLEKRKRESTTPEIVLS